MIKVHWHGRLGNQLFEYAIGRVLAEELLYSLKCGPIDGFPATRDVVFGNDINSEIVFTGQELDIPFMLKNKNKFGYVLSGWFQNYRYYQPHKTKIRSWYNRNRRRGPAPITPQDIVIHIRRTQPTMADSKISYILDGDTLKVGEDRVRFQKSLHPEIMIKANEDLLPFEFYSGILNSQSFDNLFIVTDCPEDPFLKLFDVYHPKIIAGHLMDDFNIIRSANKIILSMSTFSWWAAFLSDATDIFFPKPDYGI